MFQEFHLTHYDAVSCYICILLQSYSNANNIISVSISNVRRTGLSGNTKDGCLTCVFPKPDRVEWLKENNTGGIPLERGDGGLWWCDLTYFPEVRT